MEIKFQKVRTFLAGLVGKPDLPVAMAAELDSAIKADEALMEEVLANSANTQTASDEVVSTPQAVVVPAVVAVEQTTEKVAVVAVPETASQASANSGSLEELFNKKFSELESRIAGLQQTNSTIVAENADLRAAGSPRGIVPTSENTQVGKGRVSRTSEKDEQRIAQITRLKDIYPELMHDIE